MRANQGMLATDHEINILRSQKEVFDVHTRDKNCWWSHEPPSELSAVRRPLSWLARMIEGNVKHLTATSPDSRWCTCPAVPHPDDKKVPCVECVNIIILFASVAKEHLFCLCHTSLIATVSLFDKPVRCSQQTSINSVLLDNFPLQHGIKKNEKHVFHLTFNLTSSGISSISIPSSAISTCLIFRPDKEA